jgi:signal transduction histidine kinase
MKFRFFIWISWTALIILIVVQYYFITETFQTKRQQFDSEYSSLAKLGLYQFESRYLDFVQDSIFDLLDDYAYFAMHDLGFAQDSTEKDSIRNQILENFSVQLNISSAREKFLESYFSEAGDATEFITFNQVRRLRMLTFSNEIMVYYDTANYLPKAFREGYLLNTYTVERNNYRLQYEYYIAFPEKSEKITQEMTLTILLAVITLLIVFGVFFLTLRNLLFQKRLSELKTDFINNMTHELKTPLSTISVASSTLARSDGQLDKERIIELSNIIKKQNRHLTRMIDRILDISIWEKDQVRIDRQPTPVRQFILDILDTFNSVHPELSMDIRMKEITPDLKADIDQVHLTTVLNNLLSNVVKYGGNPPHAWIEVSATGEGLTIRVTDNGPGIGEEERRQVFDKFFRGKDTRKHAVKGLGLGLFYVKQIIEAHGGAVILDNNKQKGASFIIQIPS